MDSFTKKLFGIIALWIEAYHNDLTMMTRRTDTCVTTNFISVFSEVADKI